MRAFRTKTRVLSVVGVIALGVGSMPAAHAAQSAGATAEHGTHSVAENAAAPWAPQITDHAAGEPCTSPNYPVVAHTIGESYEFDVAPAAGDTSTITEYRYQINGGAPRTVTADASSDGSLFVTLTRFANALDVEAISSDGTVGAATSCAVNAKTPVGSTPAPDDMNGDGQPDLLLPGGAATGLPGGLWLAEGDGPSHVGTELVDIGMEGTGKDINGQGTVLASGKSPDGFTDTQVMQAPFNGYGVNDVLVYNPAMSDGVILGGSGDSSTLDPYVGESNLAADDFADAAGDNATSVAVGGTLYYSVASGAPTSLNGAEPDLLEVIGGVLYDNPGLFAAGAYGGDLTEDYALSSVNPYCQIAADDCSTGWAGWSLTSTLVDGLPALFARDTSDSNSDPSAGQLWYFSPATMYELAENLFLGDSHTITPVELAGGGWSAGDVPMTQATAVSGNEGEIDLWSVSSTHAVTPHVFDTAGDAVSTGSAESLVAPQHSWSLTTGVIDADQDLTGEDLAEPGTTPLPLTSPTETNLGGARWTGDDLFDPAVSLSSTMQDYLATTGQVLQTDQSFTVSAWVRPAATQNQAIVSQEGATGSGFTLYDADGTPTFALATSDSNGWHYKRVSGGSLPENLWTHLTAVYDAGSSRMELFVDGVQVGAATRAPVAVGSSSSPFLVGAYKYNGALSGFLDGKVADVEVWNSVAEPN